MSNDRPPRKRKTDDSTLNDMGNPLSKLFGRKTEDKAVEQPSSSKIAKVDEEEPSDKSVETKTEAAEVLEHGDAKEVEEQPGSDEIVDQEECSVKTDASGDHDGKTDEALSPMKTLNVKSASPSASLVDSLSSPLKIDVQSASPATSLVVCHSPIEREDDAPPSLERQDDAPPSLERQDDAPAEELLPLDDTPESSPCSTPEKPKVERKKKEEDEEEADEDIKVEKEVLKRQGSSSSLRARREKKSIADMGYRFNEEGKLRSIEGDEVFKFTTQKAYEELGDLIGEHVYELMVEAGLERKYFEVGRNRRFYFASPDYDTKERILVLIHGSGVVKAGQWARKLIINESLERGTQLEYIKRGLNLGWGVVVLNYNEHCVGQENRCHSPDAHGREEWKHAFKARGTRDSEILVVAHSYGGSVISNAVRDMHRVEDYRVQFVALTDSWFSEGKEVYAVNWNTQKKKLYQSNGTYNMYSGDDTHEGTSAACINSVFALLEAINENTRAKEFRDLLEISENIVISEFSARMKKKREEKGETDSTKSLELAGEKENKAADEETEKATGDEKEVEEAEEGVEKEKVEETKRLSMGDQVEQEKKEEEGAEVEKEKADDENDEKTEVEEKQKMEMGEPAVRRRERSPSNNEDDSDEGVEKDASTPEKSEDE